MWKRQKAKDVKQQIESMPISLGEIRDAIEEFAKKKREGVSLRSLVKDDYSIDYDLLSPYLKGIPIQQYFMSKETYEVFEEKDRQIPKYLDQTQQAVDMYIDVNQTLPVIDDDPYKKVSYFKLESSGLLKERPPMDFYISNQEQLLTHIKPK